MKIVKRAPVVCSGAPAHTGRASRRALYHVLFTGGAPWGYFTMSMGGTPMLSPLEGHIKEQCTMFRPHWKDTQEGIILNFVLCKGT